MKDKILEVLAQINRPENVKLRMLNRQRTLQSLVNKYGTDNVALAAGLSVASLSQYLRAEAPNIGKNAVEQAETVFKLLR